jgi:hypothetical protein
MSEPQVISKTVPLADKDYRCCWELKPPHLIPKGERYVRVVYKIEGEFQSDHICLDCWVTWSKMYEQTEQGNDKSDGERHSESSE